MSLKPEADQYFMEMNSMAKRLCVDLQEIQEAHKDTWKTLSIEEREEILNDNIIKEDVYLKYSHRENSDSEEIQYATKTIVDDNCMYRDEHSAPFSFRTFSQRDLTFIDKKPMKRVPRYIRVKEKEATQVDDEKNDVKQMKKNELNVNEIKLITNNSNNCDVIDSVGSLLPKTGLDLLDNW